MSVESETLKVSIYSAASLRTVSEISCPNLKSLPDKKNRMWHFYTNWSTTELYFAVSGNRGIPVLAWDCFYYNVRDENLEAISTEVYEGTRRILDPHNVLLRRAPGASNTPPDEARHLSRMLRSKIQAIPEEPDFSIRCNDRRSIKVHSSVLKAKWPLFETLMQHDSKETAEQKLTFVFSPGSVKVFVAYLYGIEANLVFEAAEVAEMAALYGLQDLEEAASKIATKTREDGARRLLSIWKLIYSQEYERNEELFVAAMVSKLTRVEKQLESEGAPVSPFGAFSEKDVHDIFADVMRHESTSSH